MSLNNVNTENGRLAHQRTQRLRSVSPSAHNHTEQDLSTYKCDGRSELLLCHERKVGKRNNNDHSGAKGASRQVSAHSVTDRSNNWRQTHYSSPERLETKRALSESRNPFCLASLRRLNQNLSDAIILIIDIVCSASFRSDDLLSELVLIDSWILYSQRASK